jgi:hypothetical protein
MSDSTKEIPFIQGITETKEERKAVPRAQTKDLSVCHDFTEVDQYGTFGGGTKPFLAFSELEVLIQLELARFAKHCFLVTILGLLIPLMPVILLLISPLLYRHWGQPLRDVLSGICLCFAVFLFFFTAPILVWSIKGWDYIIRLYREQEVLSQIEIFSVVLCYFLMLYFMAYVWVVSHDVTTMFQDETRRRRIFVKQYNAIAQEYLLRLEALPGWAHTGADDSDDEESQSTDRTDHSAPGPSAGPTTQSTASAPLMSRRGTGSMRKDKKLKQANEISIGGFSKFFHHLQHWSNHSSRLRQRHSDIYLNRQGALAFTGTHGVGWNISVGLVLLALIRATIPRLWLSTFHRQALLPYSDPLLCWIIVHSFFVNWLVASVWFVLLNNVRISYAHNMVQMMLISAMVSKKATVSYKSHIESQYQIAITNKEIPHMNLAKPELLKAWWMVREYALTDMMEERVPLEISLVLSMSYILIVLVYTVVDFFIHSRGSIGAFTIQSLFDTIVISNIAIRALASCVTINEIQQDHTGDLIKSRHSLLFLHSGKSDLEATDVFSVRLLDHLANRVMYHDHRQRILGSEIDSTTMATIYIETAVAVVSNVAILYRYM